MAAVGGGVPDMDHFQDLDNVAAWPAQNALKSRDEGVSVVTSGRWARFKRSLRQLFGTQSSIEDVFNKAIKRLSDTQKVAIGSQVEIEQFQRKLKHLRSGLSDLQEERLTYISKELNAALNKNNVVAIIKIFKQQMAHIGLAVHGIESLNEAQRKEHKNDLVNKVATAFAQSKVFQNSLLQRMTEIPRDTQVQTDSFVPQTGPRVEEQVTRTHTIEFLQNRYEAQLASNRMELAEVNTQLRALIGSHSEPALSRKTILEIKKQQLESAIEIIDKKLANLQKFKAEYAGKTWIGSNDFRDMAKRYALDMGEMTAAGLVNARNHTVTTRNADNRVINSRTIHRSGAIADFNEGQKLFELQKKLDVLLKELKEIKKAGVGRDKRGLERQKSLKEAEIALLQAEIKSLKKGTTLETMEAKLKEINKQIASSNDPSEALKAKRASLIRDIAERRGVLQDQFLQLLSSQYAEAVKKAKGDPSKPLSETFVLTQMSLLSPEKVKNMPGFIQNEATFMKDMAHIFKEFQDAKIAFGPPAPSVSSDGRTVRLPREADVQYPPKVTLKTLFFNVSVQDGTKNTGVQQEINKKAFAQLHELASGLEDSKEKTTLLAKIKALEAELNKNGGSYEIAAQILKLAQEISEVCKFGLGEGVNCFSGKDRTGELIKYIARDEFAAHIPADIPHAAKIKEAFDSAVTGLDMADRNRFQDRFQSNSNNRAELRKIYKEVVEKQAARAIQSFEDLLKQDVSADRNNELNQAFSRLIPQEIPNREELIQGFIEHVTMLPKNQAWLLAQFKLVAQERAAVDAFRFDLSTLNKSELIDQYEQHLARPDGVARTIAAENIGSHILKPLGQLGLSYSEQIANLWEQRKVTA